MKTLLYPTTTIRIAGKDRAKWLQGMVTNDIKLTGSTRSVECFVVDVKGRVLSHGWAFEILEAIHFVSLGANQAAKLLAHWDRYIIREDILLSDESKNWSWSFKPRTHWLEKINDNIPLSDSVLIDESTATSDRYQIALTNELLGTEWIFVGTRSTEKDSTQQEGGSGFQSISNNNTLDYLRIQHLLPVSELDFDDKSLPQELDRDSKAISFKKGCYLGQETIARLDALGQVQKKLVRLRIVKNIMESADPIAGQKLYIGEKESGWLTSVSRTENNSWIAMGYVRRVAFPIGTNLSSNGLTVTVIDQL